MSQQLLRRAWDALDMFRQAYPENWHDEDQQLMDDLMKADLDLSGVKREWVGLTDEEVEDAWGANTGHSIFGGDKSEGRTMYIAPDEVDGFARAIEAKLKEKNT